MSDEKIIGSKTAYSEPAWYDAGVRSPYYGPHHAAFRNQIRAWVDKEVMPNVNKWEKGNDTIPMSTYRGAFEVGLLPAIAGWPEDIPGIPPRPEGYDHFFSVIAQDEICRCASGGIVWGLIGAMGIGLPPVVHYGSDDLKARVAGPCIRGEKRISLAVSEATAGSDVANMRSTAEEKDDHYILNGTKKWITGGLFADFFTVAAQAGGEGAGMGGVELFLVEKTFPGVSVRAMECMGAKGSGTAYVDLENVRVPKSNYIGGVAVLMQNFVSERVGIAIQATRFARVCLAKSIERTKRRKAFGKSLIQQPVVRAKLTNMARLISCTQAWIDNIVYQVVASEEAGDDLFTAIQRIGPEAMLVKVQGAKVFEQCARDAAHLHGGDSYVKGNRVESLYRHVLSLAIPGGSEDVMIDAAGKMSLTRSRL
jgi:alkylation response protein AidB-like acyl-CoA dehydrogenase